MITKTLETGMISILNDGQMQIRDDTVIKEDGIEISRTYLRSTLAPIIDIDTITNSRIKAIAQLIWTPEVIQAYKDKLASASIIPPPF